jgi:hypothetical protein
VGMMSLQNETLQSPVYQRLAHSLGSIGAIFALSSVPKLR